MGVGSYQQVLYDPSIEKGLEDNGRPEHAVTQVHHGIHLEMLLRIRVGNHTRIWQGK